MDDVQRIEIAIDIALRYGQIDGSYHKAWVIDQILRVLTGIRYEQVIRDSCNGGDGPETYAWDTGVAP